MAARPGEGSGVRPVTVAVVNAKGGVGKTSIVANLAAWMARAGHRVLVADLDPRATWPMTSGISSKPTTVAISSMCFVAPGRL
ncbi:MAG: ParA family protein [Actinomycetota bacterium]|nr:ParA family protein [Actinomycetota bacterium]